MDQRDNLSYFFLGLGVGIAAGLILAPKSGLETRGDLKARLNEGSDYLKRRSEELRQRSTEYVDRGRDALRSQREQLSSAMEAGKQAYRETVAAPQPPAPGDTAEESA